MPDTSPKSNTKPSSSKGDLRKRLEEINKKVDPDGKETKAFRDALIKDLPKICSDD